MLSFHGQSLRVKLKQKVNRLCFHTEPRQGQLFRLASGMCINVTVKIKIFGISNPAASQSGPVKNWYSIFWSRVLLYVSVPQTDTFKCLVFICSGLTIEPVGFKQILWWWYTYTRSKPGSIHVCLVDGYSQLDFFKYDCWG